MSMGIIAVSAGLVMGGISLYQASKTRGKADDAQRVANDLAQENLDMQKKQMNDSLALQKEEAAKLEVQKQKYRDIEFKNPYENLENRAEDLKVNTQQADFQAQQGQQQRADILQNLQGAAGGSGIAGLAQALAGQGQKQTQQISASIGQQESANQRLAAQEGGRLDMAEAAGAASVQQMETGRQSTLLGIQMGQTSGANQAAQQAISNQMAAAGSQANMYGNLASTQYGIAASQQAQGMSQISGAMGGLGSIGGGGGGGGAGGGMTGTGGSNMSMQTPVGTSASGQPLVTQVMTPTGADVTDLTGGGSQWSDRRLKKNIKKISKSPSGLNIYSFEFKDSKYGKGLFQGVMSDEVPSEIVTKKNGYDAVDYSKIDVEFKQI